MKKPNKYDDYLQRKKKAAIYTRVSTLDQKEKGTSLETQKQICKDICSGKGYLIAGEFSDAISGTVEADKRKGFAEFLREAEERKFDVLVFYCFDRLARDLRVFLNIVDKLRNLGIKIVSCKENIDTNTDQGDFMMNIYAVVSNLEIRTIRTRLLNGRIRRLATTGYAGGRIPYGYKAVNKEITVEKDKTQIVKKIFEMKNQGFSLLRICDILNMENIEPPRKGKAWYPKSVAIIVKNKEKYKGGLMANNKNSITWPKVI
jgi:site-specific DNA recombinase